MPLGTACHGPRRDESHPAFPRLAGQYAEYLEQQLTLLANGQRGGGKYAKLMKTVVHYLDSDERTKLAQTYARLPIGR